VQSDAKPALEFLPSRQFPDWLAQMRTSLAFTTYQVGKLYFVGLQSDGRLSFFERTFNLTLSCISGQSVYAGCFCDSVAQ
jgi:hypothetical protein